VATRVSSCELVTRYVAIRAAGRRPSTRSWLVDLGVLHNARRDAAWVRDNEAVLSAAMRGCLGHMAHVRH